MNAKQFDNLPSYARNEIENLRAKLAEAQRVLDTIARLTKSDTYVEYIGSHEQPIYLPGHWQLVQTYPRLHDGSINIQHDPDSDGLIITASLGNGMLVRPHAANSLLVAPFDL
jgi:hypothetical protein